MLASSSTTIILPIRNAPCHFLIAGRTPARARPSPVVRLCARLHTFWHVIGIMDPPFKQNINQRVWVIALRARAEEFVYPRDLFVKTDFRLKIKAQIVIRIRVVRLRLPLIQDFRLGKLTERHAAYFGDGCHLIAFSGRQCLTLLADMMRVPAP
jgi:hypothetical protein